MKKIIETALPLSALNASAIGDKARKGHPGNMHLWWNRSPIDSSASLLKAAMEDTPKEGSEREEENKRIQNDLIAVAAGKDGNHLSAAQEYPSVCDPFSGFGGLTVAAQKIGLNVHAGDLNSVATLLTKAAVEVLAGFIDQKAVNPEAENKMYFGTEGLAADVEWYGKGIKKAVHQKLSEHYPKIKASGQDEESDVYSWVWVRTIKCPNPACGCQMPLSTSYILSKTKDHEYWAEPIVEGKAVRFHIHQGICPKDKETNKHGSNGAKFICPACGQITKDEDVKKAGKAGQLGIQLMAVCAQTSGGRIFIEPDERQISAAQISLPEDLPIGTLPDNTRWFSPPGFGMTEYVDLYTARQLLLMMTLSDLVVSEVSVIEADALKAGMPEDETPLSEGGNGAFAYAQAVSVYLALVVGKLANFQSSICTWDNRKGNVRAAFTRQAIPMTWVFAEGNPFSTPTGNYDAMLKNVVDSVAGLRPGGKAVVKQNNAVTMQFPENSVLFTELPYYDNVGYADLSDYFYIWLRRCLKNVYPDLFEKVVTSKEELSSIPEHYSGDSELAVNSYQNDIEQMFRHFQKEASDDFPSILFFEYAKQDEQTIASGESEEKLSPFENLLNTLLLTGFMLTGIWPVRTEKANQKFESYRVAVVFRKKKNDLPGSTRRGFINTLKRELPDKLDTAFQAGVDDQDKLVSGLGLGMQIFSEFKKVINADGSEMGIHDTLQIIYQEVMDYLNAHIAEEKLEEA